MGESFAVHGYSQTNLMMCFIDGDNIVQSDYMGMGNRKIIGKTSESYKNLEDTTTEYYNKLVELGVIVPEKTPEEMVGELQKNMNDMTALIASLMSEVKELKNSGLKCNCEQNSADVSECKSAGGNQ